jgi:hypothetical protein
VQDAPLAEDDLGMRMGGMGVHFRAMLKLDGRGIILNEQTINGT